MRLQSSILVITTWAFKWAVFCFIPASTYCLFIEKYTYGSHCQGKFVNSFILITVIGILYITNIKCFEMSLFFLSYIVFSVSIWYHHLHQHVVPLARISLTFSRHFSLSFIASGRSSALHPISSHSCCMYVLAGHPGFAWPYVGVHRSTSLMSSSLLLQQCPACLVRLTWKVFLMAGRWLYSWCFVVCYCQDLFNIAHNILMQLPSSFFSSCFVSIQVVHPYSSIKSSVQ